EPDPVKFELTKLGGRCTDDLRFTGIDAVVVYDTAGRDAARARERGLPIVSLQELVEFLVSVAPESRRANLERSLRAKVGPTSPNELADALHEADPSDGAALLELVRNANVNGVVID